VSRRIATVVSSRPPILHRPEFWRARVRRHLACFFLRQPLSAFLRVHSGFPRPPTFFFLETARGVVSFPYGWFSARVTPTLFARYAIRTPSRLPPCQYFRQSAELEVPNRRVVAVVFAGRTRQVEHAPRRSLGFFFLRPFLCDEVTEVWKAILPFMSPGNFPSIPPSALFFFRGRRILRRRPSRVLLVIPV